MGFGGKKQAPKFQDAAKFSNTMEYLSQFSKESQVMESFESAPIGSWIHTGSFLFNAHISGSLLKGMANNRIMTIAGDPKTGKSFLAFNIMRNAQIDDYVIYMWETENAADRNVMISHGIDTKKVIFEQPETVDDIIIPAIRLTEQLLKEQKAGKPIPKIMFVIDSTTALNTKKQYEDALTGQAKQDMGTLAKDLKRMFNMLSVRCGKLGIPVICTSHVYEKDMGNFRKRIPTGGQGAIFMSSVIPMLRKSDDRDEDRQRVGIIVTSEIVESRFSKPIDVKFYLGFQKGMNPYFGLQDYIGWEQCGIAKGKMVDLTDLAGELIAKKELLKSSFTTKKFKLSDFKAALSKAKAEFLSSHIKYHLENGLLEEDGGSYTFTDKSKANFDDEGKWNKMEDKKIHFPNATSTAWIAKHLDEAFPTAQMFTSKVFTKEVLEQLDKNVIIPMFEFKKEDFSGEQLLEAEVDAADSLDNFLTQGDE